MAIEIERKFLVKDDRWRHVASSVHYIAQGYLSRQKERTVRIRIAGEKAWVTVKGVTRGASRGEWEYEIPVADAKEMLLLCDGPVIEKRRHIVVHEGTTWEVDEFLGENEGLLVAEVELEDEAQIFALPGWIGPEVTHEARYFNSSLSEAPYSTWKMRT